MTDLTGLIAIMADKGVSRIYVKHLSPNDNSKNQIYLGGDFSVINNLPFGNIYPEAVGGKRDRFKASLDFYWLQDDGTEEQADHAQLILYPKYPEVRLSGILLGCHSAPNELIRSRRDDRYLFLGVSPADGRVFGYVALTASPVITEFENLTDIPVSGVLSELFVSAGTSSYSRNAKTVLLNELCRIHKRGFIPGEKMGNDGVARPYRAQNGGGYTLESAFGIPPNGNAEPDFMGWELKQYAVSGFDSHVNKALTLFTPEPDGGYYLTGGITAFMKCYGYAPKDGTPNRLNFSGIHEHGMPYHHNTGLTLSTNGFDSAIGKMTDVNGGILLLDRSGNKAASWSFGKLMSHWNRKHAQAVYVPSVKNDDTGHRSYQYGKTVRLYSGTDFMRFLGAVVSGSVYYDPGINLKKLDTDKPVSKKRSQFRVKLNDLDDLYENLDIVNVCDVIS